MFYNCSNLTSIEIPKSLETVDIFKNGVYAKEDDHGTFEGTNLTEVKFEDGATRIPANLFIACHSLNNIKIPNTVTEIGNNAFRHCINLTSAILSDSTVTIGASAFQNCTALDKIVIPNSVTRLNSYTFAGCTNLCNVSLSKNLVGLGAQVFYNCSNLTSIEIPKSLETVDLFKSGFYSYPDDHGTFEGTNLTEVKFENGVTHISCC